MKVLGIKLRDLTHLKFINKIGEHDKIGEVSDVKNFLNSFEKELAEVDQSTYIETTLASGKRFKQVLLDIFDQQTEEYLGHWTQGEVDALKHYMPDYTNKGIREGIKNALHFRFVEGILDYSKDTLKKIAEDRGDEIMGKLIDVVFEEKTIPDNFGEPENVMFKLIDSVEHKDGLKNESFDKVRDLMKLRTRMNGVVQSHIKPFSRLDWSKGLMDGFYLPKKVVNEFTNKEKISIN